MASYTSAVEDQSLLWSFYYNVLGREAFVNGVLNGAQDAIVVLAENHDRSVPPVLVILNLDGTVASTTAIELPRGPSTISGWSYRDV